MADQQASAPWLAHSGSYRGVPVLLAAFLQPQALLQHSSTTFQQPYSSQFSHQSHSHPLSFTQQPVQPQPQFPTLTQPGALGFGSTNPSLSLGAFPGIPARFITAIQRGEYVNFHHLFSAIIFGSSARPGFAIVLDDQTENTSPALSLVPKEVDSRKSQIKNFAQWIRTWNTFMSVFLHFRPQFVSQLHGYQPGFNFSAGCLILCKHWLTY